ncbi:MAG: hypothetical protein ACRYF0_11315 [Janthinobacterium lividum]
MSPRALYNEAMRLNRHPEEVLPDTSVEASLFGWGGTRYHPHDRLTVQDTDLGAMPLKGVK